MDDTIVAGANPVETTPEATPASVEPGTITPEGEKDAETLLREANAHIAKVELERDNYKRGLLAAKGKQPDNGGSFQNNLLSPDDEDIEAIIERKVSEKLLDKQLEEANKQKDLLIEKTLRENGELKRALKGIPGTPTAAGSNQDQPQVRTSHFSPEQEAALKARGLDPAEVLKNMPQSGQMGSPAS